MDPRDAPSLGVGHPWAWTGRRTAVRTDEQGDPLFTVIICVALVVGGIVGAMKMENHLDPHKTRTPADR
jgi:hypothetical protein